MAILANPKSRPIGTVGFIEKGKPLPKGFMWADGEEIPIWKHRKFFELVGNRFGKPKKQGYLVKPLFMSRRGEGDPEFEPFAAVKVS